MVKNIGLWIDHRRAVIVTIEDEVVNTREIESALEKHTRFSSGSHSKANFDTHGNPNQHANTTRGSMAEDMRDRQFGNHLGNYYDRVITSLHGADSVFIIGPGEAKVELETQLKRAATGGQVIAMETVDKMTNPQITAMVQKHFHMG